MNIDGPAQLRFRALWLTIGWGLVGLVIYLSLGHVSAPVIDGGDKIGHFSAYGALAYWFMQIVRTLRGRLAVAVYLVLMGVGLEFIQAMLPYRDFDVLDMLANSIGVAIGAAVAIGTPNLLGWVEANLPTG